MSQIKRKSYFIVLLTTTVVVIICLISSLVISFHARKRLIALYKIVDSLQKTTLSLNKDAQIRLKKVRDLSGRLTKNEKNKRRLYIELLKKEHRIGGDSLNNVSARASHSLTDNPAMRAKADREYENQQNDSAAAIYLRYANFLNATQQLRLGYLYSVRDGAENRIEAMKWFQKAANTGDVFAMYYIGLVYEMGQGVDENIQEAKKWYRKAARYGNKEAQYALTRLGNN